jgi:hypothetical protein
LKVLGTIAAIVPWPEGSSVWPTPRWITRNFAGTPWEGTNEGGTLDTRSGRGRGFRPADTTQALNLERKLYGPASKRQILGFQIFDQVSVVAPVAIGSRAGLTGPRKLEDGSGFLTVR